MSTGRGLKLRGCIQGFFGDRCSCSSRRTGRQPYQLVFKHKAGPPSAIMRCRFCDKLLVSSPAARISESAQAPSPIVPANAPGP
ncbi:hypothetical protein WJX75_006343 [Coccomyxa subellipsoidea]|uniref:Uncharacterized protein n=1 Tax=Coccomyxa subellipsoidea TaxID=248742 RepID=A0ABR2YLD0_9CHLO